MIQFLPVSFHVVSSFLVFVCSCRISKPRNSDSRWASRSRTSSKWWNEETWREYEELWRNTRRNTKRSDFRFNQSHEVTVTNKWWGQRSRQSPSPRNFKELANKDENIWQEEHEEMETVKRKPFCSELYSHFVKIKGFQSFFKDLLLRFASASVGLFRPVTKWVLTGYQVLPAVPLGHWAPNAPDVLSSKFSWMERINSTQLAGKGTDSSDSLSQSVYHEQLGTAFPWQGMTRTQIFQRHLKWCRPWYALMVWALDLQSGSDIGTAGAVWCHMWWTALEHTVIW